MVEHRSMLSIDLMWMQAAYESDADDAVLQSTPFSFDVSVWEFCLAVAVGGAACNGAPKEQRGPEVSSEAIEAE